MSIMSSSQVNKILDAPLGANFPSVRLPNNVAVLSQNASLRASSEFTLNHAQQLATLESAIAKNELKVEKVSGQINRDTVAQYQYIVADLIQQGLYPRVSPKGSVTWSNQEDFGGPKGALGRAISSALGLEIHSPKVKRLRELSAKLVAKHSRELRAIDLDQPETVFSKVVHLFNAHKLTSQTAIVAHVNNKHRDQKIESLVRKVLRLNDEERETFQQLLASAKSAKNSTSPAVDFNRQSITEHTDVTANAGVFTEYTGNAQVIAGVEVLTTNQLCTYLGISRNLLYTIRNTDDNFPHPFTFTDDKGGLKWKLESVKEWALKKMESSHEK